jgi:hypothetical protein
MTLRDSLRAQPDDAAESLTFVMESPINQHNGDPGPKATIVPNVIRTRRKLLFHLFCRISFELVQTTERNFCRQAAQTGLVVFRCCAREAAADLEHFFGFSNVQAKTLKF